MKRTLIAMAMAGCVALSFELGRRSVKSALPEPEVVVRIDTVTIPAPPPDTVWREKTVVRWLPVADSVTTDKPEARDSVPVLVPISRYVFDRPSMYHAEISGYDVKLENLTVYPTTVTRTEYRKAESRWSLGISAGYGAALCGGKVQMAPYIGIGITYNLITW